MRLSEIRNQNNNSTYQPKGIRLSDVMKQKYPTPSQRGSDFQRPEEIAQESIPKAWSIPKNIAKDAYDIGKGVVQAVTSPIETAKGIKGLIRGAGENIGAEVYGNYPLEERSPEAKMAMQAGESVAEAVQNPAKTMYEKPLTVASMFTPAKYNPAVNITKGMGKAAVATAKGAVAVAKPVKDVGNWLSRYAVGQATGLNPSSITEIISKPEKYAPEVMKTYSKEAIAEEAITNINKRMEDLSETGKEYQPIRNARTEVPIRTNQLNKIFNKYGIEVKDGDLVFSKESIPTSSSDEANLRKWYNTYGKDDLNSNSFLNSRKSLDNLKNYEGKTDAVDALLTSIRKNINAQGHRKIPGLVELDRKFSSETRALSQVKKDYFNANGTLKDGAASKIANLSKSGREPVLKRLENISPGIGEKIKTLSVIEDINNASGQKVGAYGRAALAGAGLYSVNIPMLIAAALASPKVATQILRGYGKVLNVKDSVLNGIIRKYEVLRKAK